MPLIEIFKKFKWILPFHGLHHFYILLLPPLFPLLKADIAPSYTMLGILKAAFTAMGFLMILSGRLTDIIGERKTILLEFSLIPIFMILCGLASSYWMLLVFVAGFGFSKIMYHPAGLSYISRGIDRKLRGTAIGVHESVGNIGGGLAFIVLGSLGELLGWRRTFMVMAIPAAVLVVANLILGNGLEDGGRSSPRTTVETSQETGRTGIKPKRISAFYLQVGSSTLSILALGGFVSFLSSFLYEIYGLGAALSGSLVGLGYLGGVLGNLIGGRISDRFGPIVTYSAFTTLYAVPISAVIWLRLPFWGLLLGLLLCFFLRSVRNPADKALLADNSPHEGRGKAYGLLFAAYTMGSLISGPLFGFLIDSYGMIPAFSIVPVLSVVSALVRYQVKNLDD